MGIVLNTNMSALAAQNNLRKTQGSVDQALGRLSSGLRINRAADDAAGLTISEKLRSQTRGLTQSVQNAQDGISLVQTAEGGMNEIHVMLQRARTLAIQSANDTNTREARDAIQLEIFQLVSQTTQIAERAEFNGIKLLDGSFTGKLLQVGANEGQTMPVDIRKVDGKALGLEVPSGSSPKAERRATNTLANASDGSTYERHSDGTIHEMSAAGAYRALTGDRYVGMRDSGGAVYDPALRPTNPWSYHPPSLDGFGNITTPQSWARPDPFDGSVTQTSWSRPSDDPFASSRADYGGAQWAATRSHMSEFISDGSGASPDPHPFDGRVPETATLTASTGTLPTATFSVSGTEVFDPRGAKVGTYDDGSRTVDFGGGTTATFDLSLYHEDWYVPMKTVGSVSITSVISVQSHNLADMAIPVLDRAIEIVSGERASLGAAQNRLEHVITANLLSARNLDTAESRIRDADVAKEMSHLARGQIFQQAGVAMLAQANQTPQAILKLLPNVSA